MDGPMFVTGGLGAPTADEDGHCLLPRDCCDIGNPPSQWGHRNRMGSRAFGPMSARGVLQGLDMENTKGWGRSLPPRFAADSILEHRRRPGAIAALQAGRRARWAKGDCGGWPRYLRRTDLFALICYGFG